MNDLITAAEHRMQALRLEASELWAEAAAAWHKTIASFQADGNNSALAASHLDEMKARARSAEARSTEPDAARTPVGKVEAVAEAHDKPEAERDPGAVNHLEAGDTEGSSGAK